MFKQSIEFRKKRTVDKGTMGFSDYETVYDLTFSEWVNTITEKYNKDNIKIINISYINDETAIIVYKEKKTS